MGVWSIEGGDRGSGECGQLRGGNDPSPSLQAYQQATASLAERDEELAAVKVRRCIEAGSPLVQLLGVCVHTCTLYVCVPL